MIFNRHLDASNTSTAVDSNAAQGPTDESSVEEDIQTLHTHDRIPRVDV